MTTHAAKVAAATRSRAPSTDVTRAAPSSRKKRKAYWWRTPRRSGRTAAAAASSLSVAVDDAPTAEVVRRELDLHAVPQKDPDAVAPHLPCRVAERLVAVVELDPEHPVPQRLDDLAFELELLFLVRDVSPFLRLSGRRRAAPARGRGPRRPIYCAICATLVASGPLAPWRSSYSTRAPSARVLKPSATMFEWCTKRSFEPSSGVMKPYPLLSLNHLTVPLSIKTPPLHFHEREGCAGREPNRSRVVPARYQGAP